jgi:predicted transposase/invertase (TIGR01784 family)
MFDKRLITNKNVRQLYDEIESIMENTNQRAVYDACMKTLRDLASMYEDAFQIGRQKGLEIARQEGIERTIKKTIQRMQNNGFSVEQIATFLSMTPENISKYL